MKSTASRRAWVLGLVGVFAIAGVTMAWAQTGPETYTALAKWKLKGEEKSARLTIVIERYTTDAERDQAKEALKTGGTAALQQVLEKMPPTGSIAIEGGAPAPFHFARALDMSGGRLLTLLSARPLGFIGGAEPGAKPKAGFDIGYVSLEVKTGRIGQGDAAPAAKMKMNKDEALVVEDYGGREVWLSEVQLVKP